MGPKKKTSVGLLVFNPLWRRPKSEFLYINCEYSSIVFLTHDPQVRAVVDEEKSNVEYCKEESGSSSLRWKANIGDVEWILKGLGHKIVSYLQVKVRTSTGLLIWKMLLKWDVAITISHAL